MRHRLEDNTAQHRASAPPESPEPRRGRPPSTTPAELARLTLELFTTHGVEHTTVDDIAEAAGISRRTFFRYFDSKTSAIWYDFDAEVGALRAWLDAADPTQHWTHAVHQAVVSVNRHRVADLPELRQRMRLIGSDPELAATAAHHYDAWEHTISTFVARRTGQSPQALVPLAVGRCTLAAARAAFDVWVSEGDQNLPHYLDQALQSLFAGFQDPPSDTTPAGTAPASAE